MNYTSLLGVSTTGIVFIALGGALLLFIFLFCLLVPIKYWVHAMLSGAYIPSYRLVALRSRKIDLKKIVEAYILSKKSKMDHTYPDRHQDPPGTPGVYRIKRKRARKCFRAPR